MIELKRILHPTDFSENSAVALKYACALCDVFGAELHLLSVVQEPIAVSPDPVAAFAIPGGSVEELQQAATEKLNELPDPEWATGKSIVRQTRVGTPFVDIVRYAQEAKIDLIVIGTHGRTGLVHALLGSVAENVVRKASCPVLTVRPDAHQFVAP